MSPKITEERRENRKRKILLAAKKVFFKKGFELTTMKDIKEEAGVSFGGLYLYYKTKEEIFLNVFNMEMLANDNNILNYENISSKEKLRMFIHNQKEEFKNINTSFIPVVYEYFMSGWREEYRLNILKLRYNEAVTLLENIIHQGIKDREFHPKYSPAEIAAKIISDIEGLHMLMILFKFENNKIDIQLDMLEDTLFMLLN